MFYIPSPAEMRDVHSTIIFLHDLFDFVKRFCRISKTVLSFTDDDPSGASTVNAGNQGELVLALFYE